MAGDRSSRRQTLDPHLTQKMQGQKFVAVLKARLISLGYTVAVPEPDAGEDLWIGSANQGDSPVRTIYRAQAKGLYSFDQTIKEETRRYDANDYLATIEYAILQPHFVYFFGIRDERLESATGEHFHIGCIPAQGFLNHLRGQYPGAGTDGDRYYLQLIVKWDRTSARSTEFLVKVRRAHRFNITPYFRDVELGLRVCSARASAPECLEPIATRRRMAHR
jgi:hypothetical protein